MENKDTKPSKGNPAVVRPLQVESERIVGGKKVTTYKAGEIFKPSQNEQK